MTRLTTREKEVLDLASEGLADKAIAARLGIGYRTVKSHLYHSYHKLGARNRAQAAVKWQQVKAAERGVER